MTAPQRGDIWFARLDPTEGHEQGGDRPCLILSTNVFNAGAAGLAVVVPITTRYKGHLAGLHVPIHPPEGGLNDPSWVLCDQIRTIDQGRLRRRAGSASAAAIKVVEELVRVLLEL